MGTKVYRKNGFSLVEVLVVLIVLAIGLLGMASLQVTTVKFTADSGQKSQAMFFAQDLVERIRANREAVVDGNGNVTASNYNKTSGDAIPTMGTDCTTNVCNADDLATFDMDQWGTMASTYLPMTDDQIADDMVVCLDDTPDATDPPDCSGGSTFVIFFAWTSQDPTAENSRAVYSLSFEP